MALLREHYRDENQRITAGIPSLSPQKRRDITESQLGQIYQKACQNEYKRNEEAALAPDGDIEDTSDWGQIVGIPLHGLLLAKRLRKLNCSLWFEQSKADPNSTGIYIREWRLGEWNSQFICGIQTEINPEFTLRIKNEDGTPKGIIPGWRRMLMRLIRARYVTEPAAYAIFGPPSRGSENWARFTQ